MFGQILAIARNTFVESLRQPVMFVLVLAGGILQIFNTLLSAYSMGFSEETEVHGDDKMLLDMGLATVLVCATMLAAFLATSVMSREIENKTALTVISKPVGRPLFVIGKYVGVGGAIMWATVTMLLFFLFAIRHEVMSTARDHLDGPVVLFSILAVAGSIAIGIWCNYFYGWVFSSTAIGFMLPLTLLGYVATLFLSKEWHPQGIGTDLKPQIMIAASCVMMAMLVLTAVAVASSTRLGQVMTIVVCAGVFLLGLLSNHLIGRYAFTNHFVSSIRAVELPREQTALNEAGQTIDIVLQGPPSVQLKVGDSLYYSADPNGVEQPVPTHARWTGDPTSSKAIAGSDGRRALVIQKFEPPARYTLVNIGGLPIERIPRTNDYLFIEPSKVNWPARAAWSVAPNLQFFWLVDAITQGNKIPARYLALIAGYTAVQVAGLLAVGVMLFQTRDLG